MRFASLLIAGLLMIACGTQAATGKVLKVLPHFLDSEGRIALSPSLFERDAYQAHLRLNPARRGGLRFDVQWKTRGGLWDSLKVRVQLRGTAEETLPKERVLEKEVAPTRWLSRWTSLDLQGQAYKDFGEVTAWRVTLWEGDNLLAEEKSFLW